MFGELAVEKFALEANASPGLICFWLIKFELICFSLVMGKDFMKAAKKRQNQPVWKQHEVL